VLTIPASDAGLVARQAEIAALVGRANAGDELAVRELGRLFDEHPALPGRG